MPPHPHLQHLPLGALAGASPHGVVVSLPTLADVIGYETGCARVKACVTAGYPRFVEHALVGALQARVRALLGAGGALAEDAVLAVASVSAGARVLAWLAAAPAADAALSRGFAVVPAAEVLRAAGARCDACGGCDSGAARGGCCAWAAVLLPHATPHEVCLARAYLQHTGARIASRAAEDALATLGGKGCSCSGSGTCVEVDEGTLAALLQRTFCVSGGGSSAPVAPVVVSNSGMAAFVGTLGAVQALQAERAVEMCGGGSGRMQRWACPAHPGGRLRDTWMQIGWAYLDTSEALMKFHAPHCATCDGLDGGEEAHPLVPPDLAAAVAPLLTTCSRGLVRVILPGRGSVGGAEAESASATAVLRGMRALLCHLGRRIAGVITECPSNPLVQTADLAAIAADVRTHAPGAVIIVDPTVAGLGNVNPLPLADAVVVSITKYVAAQGDAMGGSVIVNPLGPHASRFSELLAGEGACITASAVQWVSPCLLLPAVGGAGSGNGKRVGPPEPLFWRDTHLLAAASVHTSDVVRTLGANTRDVAQWLEAAIERDVSAASDVGDALRLSAVHWAYGGGAGGSAHNFERLCPGSGGGCCPSNGASGGVCARDHPGSMVTLELKGTWEEGGAGTEAHHASACALLSRFFDKLPFAKGPSFGTAFTLACPFIFLAHYDLVSSQQGRAALFRSGINPYLVRLSIGAEGAEVVRAALGAAMGWA